MSSDGIMSLGIYHPWRKGANPDFDPFSGLVLDLKAGKEDAIQYFTQQIQKAIELAADLSICVVPGHDPTKTTSGIRSVAAGLCKAGPMDATGCLVRTLQIAKLARGGDRSLQKQLETLAVIRPELIMGRRVLLLDDVTTSGNSLLAGRIRLSQAGAKSITMFAVGRTA
jgi:predicted amidophosphoribosyltransferase